MYQVYSGTRYWGRVSMGGFPVPTCGLTMKILRSQIEYST